MQLTDNPRYVPVRTQSIEPQFPWFAVRTRCNLEDVAAAALENKGFQPYLPTYRTRRRWSNRIVMSETSLFKGYVFCRFDPRHRLSIMTTHGVIGIVSCGSELAPVNEQEIKVVRAFLHSGLSTEPYPFLREGKVVRIQRGTLAGIEGILVKKKSDFRLVISVTMLQRSVSVEIDRGWVAESFSAITNGG